MPDVFISYATDDRKAVTPIAEVLGSLGLDVWFDQKLRTGELWDEAIEKHLRASLAVLVCWSPKSVNSMWVLNEAIIAREKGNLIPVFIEECEAPATFARVQGIKIVGWKGEPDNAGWYKVLDSLQGFVNRDDLIRREKERVEDLAPSLLVNPTRGFALADLRSQYGRLDHAEKEELLQRYDFRESNSDSPTDGTYWMDYLGNAGGNSIAAYCMAYLLAQDRLDIRGAGALPHGDILVLGGGQVDPNQRLEPRLPQNISPLRAMRLLDARRKPKRWMVEAMSRWPFFLKLRRYFKTQEMPKLYRQQTVESFRGAYNVSPPERTLFAIPGWGDHYDGLAAFDNIFCTSKGAKGNTIGGWQCLQHRSYWHLRLPYNWWVWGIDLTFDEPFDRDQIKYFTSISDQMGPADSLILMTSEPLWLLAHEHGRDEEENFVKIVSIAREKGVRIVLVVASGIAHYNRYYSHELDVHFLVAGAGGGAALEPTHTLNNAISVRWPERVMDSENETGWSRQSAGSLAARDYDLQLKRHARPAEGVIGQVVQDVQDALAPLGEPLYVKRRRQPLRPQAPKCYPDKSRAYLISLRAILFPFHNVTLCAVFGLYLLVAVLLAQPVWEGGPGQAFSAERFLAMPVLSLLALGAWLCLGAFALICYAQMPLGVWPATRVGGKIIAGIVHFVVQVACAVIIAQLLHGAICQGGVCPHIFSSGEASTELLVVWGLFFILAAIAAGIVFGMYWIIMAATLKTHVKELCSALGVVDYRNFLRFKFERDQLTIYPLGIDRVPGPNRWMNAPRGRPNPLPNNPRLIGVAAIDVRLIENPIIIGRYDEAVD
jgi:hypothetical protein